MVTSMVSGSSLSVIATAPGRRPLVGHAVEFMRRPVPFLKSLRQYGEVVRIYFGTSPVYALTTAAAAQVALAGRGEHFGRDKFNERMARIIGEGMSTTVDPALHLRQRRVVQPALHRRRVGSYVPGINTVLAEASAGWVDGQHRDFAADMFALSTAVMARALTAAEAGAGLREEINNSFLDYLHTVLARMQTNLPLKNRLPTRANKRFTARQTRLLAAVEHTIAAYHTAGTDHPDLLSTLITAVDDTTGQPMPPHQLRTEIMGLMVAAVDSLAIILTWLFFEIGRNPTIENRLLNELQPLHGQPPTAAQLPQLTYLNQVITEVLRLHNPAIAVLRRATTYTEIQGHPIPATTRVLISPYALGHDPRHYPDPEHFDPDRWHPDNTIPHTAYLPFLTGRYKCAGEALAWTALKTAIAHLLPHWKITPNPTTPIRETFHASYIQPTHMPVQLHHRTPTSAGGAGGAIPGC